MPYAATVSRPTVAPATSSELIVTNCICWDPPTPLTVAEPTGRASDTPAAARTRGLIIVRSAPVSSRSCADALPFTVALTMIRCPGAYVMVAPPFTDGEDAAAAPAGGGAPS